MKSKRPTPDRKARRADWRKNIRIFAQSSQAKQGGFYDRAERRRIAKSTWQAASPNVTRVTPKIGHWMANRVEAMQRGLMALLWRGQWSKQSP